MKKLLLLTFVLSFILSSCGNGGSNHPHVYYTDCNRLNDLVYYNSTPYSGKVWSKDESSYLEVQDGHQIAIIGLYDDGSIACKMEFQGSDEMIMSGFSKEGVLIYKQNVTNRRRYRPQIWDFDGNTQEYSNNNDTHIQPILSYCQQHISPIAKAAESAYHSQLNKASY